MIGEVAAQIRAYGAAMPQPRNAHLVVLKAMPGDTVTITGPSFDGSVLYAKIGHGGVITYDVEYWLDGKLERVVLFDTQFEVVKP